MVLPSVLSFPLEGLCISCRTGLVVKSFSFRLSKEVFIYLSFLKVVFVIQYSWLAVFGFQYGECIISCLHAFKVSAEKSAHNLMWMALYVKSHFSVFKINCDSQLLGYNIFQGRHFWTNHSWHPLSFLNLCFHFFFPFWEFFKFFLEVSFVLLALSPNADIGLLAGVP